MVVQEKRKRARYKIEKVQVRYRPKGTLAMLDKVKGTVFDLLDIGQGGLQFKAPRAFRQGVKLLLSIDLPGMKASLELEGMVRWCNPSPANIGRKTVYCIGVQFGRGRQAHKERLNRYLTSEMMAVRGKKV